MKTDHEKRQDYDDRTRRAGDGRARTAQQAEKQGETFVLKGRRRRSASRAGPTRCRRARGNVVNPDTVVAEYGADALRLYEMFMGPLEATKPWSMEGVNGVRGFLDRVWRMITAERSETLELNPAVARRRAHAPSRTACCTARSRP